MTQVPERSSAGSAPALSLSQRITGVLFSPRATFESIVAHPQWVVILLLLTLVVAGAMYAFLSTPTGLQAMVDDAVLRQERTGTTVSDAQYQGMLQSGWLFKSIAVGSALFVGPLFTMLIAAVLFGVYGAMLGGGGSYKQTMAVVAHSGVVSTLGYLVGLVIGFFKGTMSGATNLGVLFPMIAEESFLSRFLGTIDLVWVWYLIVLAIGLGVLFRRTTSSIAMALFGLYLVIALGIAAFTGA